MAAFGVPGKAVPTAGGLPVFTGGNKRGQDTKHGFLSPLDSPYLPLRRDALRLRGETGVAGARFRASGRFWEAVMPWISLALSAAHDSARPSGAGRERRRCEKLRFDQGCALGAANAPVGPSLLDARPKGVASQGKVGESRGAGKPWCPCLFCPRRRAAALPRHVMANIPGPGRA